MTNRHVLRGRLPGEAVTLVAADLRAAEARVVALSPWMDLAVLRVPAGFLPAVAAEDAPERAGLAVTAAGIDAAGDATAGAAAGGGGGGGGAAGGDRRLRAGADRPAAGGAAGVLRRAAASTPRRGWSAWSRRSASGRRPRRRAGAGQAVEVFALRAAAVRAEVRRLLGPAAR